MAVLATIGAIDTGAITLKRWGLMGSLTCPGGAEGCDKVLNSAWGSLFGQPLSLFGFLAYGAVLVMAVVPLVLRGEARTEPGAAKLVGAAPVQHGHGCVQPPADGGDGVQDPGLLRLLPALRPPEPEPCSCSPSWEGNGRTGGRSSSVG